MSIEFGTRTNDDWFSMFTKQYHALWKTMHVATTSMVYTFQIGITMNNSMKKVVMYIISVIAYARLSSDDIVDAEMVTTEIKNNYNKIIKTIKTSATQNPP